MCEKSSKDINTADTFTKIPPDCLATIISSTSPRDACQLAAVCKTLKSISSSDAVWGHFLPTNIPHSDDEDLSVFLKPKSDNAGEVVHSMSKKDLFFLLFHCPPILIDGGRKCVWLDRETGKKCCGIAARDLDITWGDTPKYWQWHFVSNSRFSEVAELISVCWFEIKTRLKSSILSQDTIYSSYLIFRTTESTYGFNTPAEASVTINGTSTTKQCVYLDEQQEEEEVKIQRLIVPRRRRVELSFHYHHHHHHHRATLAPVGPARKGVGEGRARRRDDGWLEVEVGEFYVGKKGEDLEVEMGVLEVESGVWKGGLVVAGFDIRPKVLQKRFYSD